MDTRCIIIGHFAKEEKKKRKELNKGDRASLRSRPLRCLLIVISTDKS